MASAPPRAGSVAASPLLLGTPAAAPTARLREIPVDRIAPEPAPAARAASTRSARRARRARCAATASCSRSSCASGRRRLRADRRRAPLARRAGRRPDDACRRSCARPTTATSLAARARREHRPRGPEPGRGWRAATRALADEFGLTDARDRERGRPQPHRASSNAAAPARAARRRARADRARRAERGPRPRHPAGRRTTTSAARLRAARRRPAGLSVRQTEALARRAAAPRRAARGRAPDWFDAELANDAVDAPLPRVRRRRRASRRDRAGCRVELRLRSAEELAGPGRAPGGARRRRRARGRGCAPPRPAGFLVSSRPSGRLAQSVRAPL